MTASSNRPASPLTSSLLEDIEDLEALRSEWDELLADSAVLGPMLSPFWLLTWWQTFGPVDGRRLMAWTFRQGGRLVGLVPALRRTHRYFGVLPMRRLELLGSGESEADEIMSEYLGPIVARGFEVAVANALAAVWASEPDWQEIVLTALDGSSPGVAGLEPALTAQGWDLEIPAANHCPFIELPSSWENYLSALSSHDRYWAKSSLRDFAAWAGDEWQVQRASNQAELVRGREILHELHAQRWQQDGKQGVFASSRFLQFHDQVMPRLLEQNALDLCWLSVHGKPIAVLYNIVWRNGVYCYQIGRSVTVPKRIRPGAVLHLFEIKRAIESGRQEYDFLGGDALFKRQLALAKRPLLKIRIVRPSLAEAARRILEGARLALREARKKQAATGQGSAA